MTQGAGGAVAIWHDIASEGLDEFYAWHGEEHMPVRNESTPVMGACQAALLVGPQPDPARAAGGFSGAA